MQTAVHGVFLLRVLDQCERALEPDGLEPGRPGPETRNRSQGHQEHVRGTHLRGGNAHQEDDRLHREARKGERQTGQGK